MKDASKNRHDSREAWLRAAATMLTPDFLKQGYVLPPKIRFNLGFTSYGKKLRVTGECIYPEASADGSFEVIVRSDQDNAEQVLGVLAHELLHAVTSPEHKKAFRDGALRMGFDIRDGLPNAMPGQTLQDRLRDIAEQLGPLPHAKIDFAKLLVNGKPPVADRKKPQKGRLRKAECLSKNEKGETCGYNVWLTSSWIDELGPPHCPAHGAMFPHPPKKDVEAFNEEPAQ